MPPQSANPPRVLIVTDKASFSRTLIHRWKTEPIIPEFTVLGSEVARKAALPAQTLVILDSLSREKLETFLASSWNKAGYILCLTEEEWNTPPPAGFPRVTFMRKTENWLDILTALVAEVLRRQELSVRMIALEEQLQASRQHAALGRYMLEIRHNFNNALTSILGNAELVLLEEDSLGPEMKDQLQTIQGMALRLYEMMQRFSSLETEMQCTEKASQNETDRQLPAVISTD